MGYIQGLAPATEGKLVIAVGRCGGGGRGGGASTRPSTAIDSERASTLSAHGREAPHRDPPASAPARPEALAVRVHPSVLRALRRLRALPARLHGLGLADRPQPPAAGRAL